MMRGRLWLHLRSRTTSLADRAVEISWGETLMDWILQPDFHSGTCTEQLVRICLKYTCETGLLQSWDFNKVFLKSLHLKHEFCLVYGIKVAQYSERHNCTAFSSQVVKCFGS